MRRGINLFYQQGVNFVGSFAAEFRLRVMHLETVTRAGLLGVWVGFSVCSYAGAEAFTQGRGGSSLTDHRNLQFMEIISASFSLSRVRTGQKTDAEDAG